MNQCMSYNHAAKVECERSVGHEGWHVAFFKTGTVVGWSNHPSITQRYEPYCCEICRAKERE